MALNDADLEFDPERGEDRNMNEDWGEQMSRIEHDELASIPSM